MRVIVIGAGVSGLLAARCLIRHGCKVTILEDRADVGGSWLKSDPKALLQCPWQEYTFPDFPWPPSLQPKGDTAMAAEVLAYVRAYAHHYHLVQHVRFQSRLVNLAREGTGKNATGWNLVIKDLQTKKHGRIQCTHVVLATGLHSNPATPKYRGQDVFLGTRVHARNLQADIDFNDKDVVILGNSMTCYDTLADYAVAQEAESVALLYRKVHWPLPTTDSLGCLHTHSSQLSVLQPVPYYTSKPRLTNKLLRPWVARQAEQELIRSFEMETIWEMKPSQSLVTDTVQGMQLVVNSDHWAASARHPRARTLSGRVRCFTPDGVVLDNGEEIPADCVLFCTGFSQKSPYIDPKLSGMLGSQDDGIYLYRSILHPDVKNLFFVGCAADTTQTMFTAALQSEWLATLVTGGMKLPSRRTMHADLAAQRVWRRSHMPAAQDRATRYGTYSQAYWDQLAGDLHISLHATMCFPWRSLTVINRTDSLFEDTQPVPLSNLPLPESLHGNASNRLRSPSRISIGDMTELGRASLNRLRIANASADGCRSSGAGSISTAQEDPLGIQRSMSQSVVKREPSSAGLAAGATAAEGPGALQSSMRSELKSKKSRADLTALADGDNMAARTVSFSNAPNQVLGQQGARPVKEKTAPQPAQDQASGAKQANNDSEERPSVGHSMLLGLAVSKLKRLLSGTWGSKPAVSQDAEFHDFAEEDEEPSPADSIQMAQTSKSFTAGVTRSRLQHQRSRLSGASTPNRRVSQEQGGHHRPQRSTTSFTHSTLARHATLTAGLLAHQASEDLAAQQRRDIVTSPRGSTNGGVIHSHTGSGHRLSHMGTASDDPSLGSRSTGASHPSRHRISSSSGTVNPLDPAAHGSNASRSSRGSSLNSRPLAPVISIGRSEPSAHDMVHPERPSHDDLVNRLQFSLPSPARGLPALDEDREEEHRLAAGSGGTSRQSPESAPHSPVSKARDTAAAMADAPSAESAAEGCAALITVAEDMPSPRPSSIGTDAIPAQSIGGPSDTCATAAVPTPVESRLVKAQPDRPSPRRVAFAADVADKAGSPGKSAVWTAQAPVAVASGEVPASGRAQEATFSVSVSTGPGRVAKLSSPSTAVPGSPCTSPGTPQSIATPGSEQKISASFSQQPASNDGKVPLLSSSLMGTLDNLTQFLNPEAERSSAPGPKLQANLAGAPVRLASSGLLLGKNRTGHLDHPQVPKLRVPTLLFHQKLATSGSLFDDVVKSTPMPGVITQHRGGLRLVEWQHASGQQVPYSASSPSLMEMPSYEIGTGYSRAQSSSNSVEGSGPSMLTSQRSIRYKLDTSSGGDAAIEAAVGKGASSPAAARRARTCMTESHATVVAPEETAGRGNRTLRASMTFTHSQQRPAEGNKPASNGVSAGGSPRARNISQGCSSVGTPADSPRTPGGMSAGKPESARVRMQRRLSLNAEVFDAIMQGKDPEACAAEVAGVNPAANHQLQVLNARMQLRRRSISGMVDEVHTPDSAAGASSAKFGPGNTSPGMAAALVADRLNEILALSNDPLAAMALGAGPPSKGTVACGSPAAGPVQLSKKSFAAGLSNLLGASAGRLAGSTGPEASAVQPSVPQLLEESGISRRFSIDRARPPPAGPSAVQQRMASGLLTRRPGAHSTLDAPAQELLTMLAQKPQTQTQQGYAEKSYGTWLRNTAVGLEEGG